MRDWLPRDTSFNAFKLRRQHRIGPYFVDLGCLAHRLVIEIDCSQHAELAEETKDDARTAYRVTESSGSGMSR